MRPNASYVRMQQSYFAPDRRPFALADFVGRQFGQIEASCHADNDLCDGTMLWAELFANEDVDLGHSNDGHVGAELACTHRRHLTLTIYKFLASQGRFCGSFGLCLHNNRGHG